MFHAHDIVFGRSRISTPWLPSAAALYALCLLPRLSGWCCRSAAGPSGVRRATCAKPLSCWMGMGRAWRWRQSSCRTGEAAAEGQTAVALQAMGPRSWPRWQQQQQQQHRCQHHHQHHHQQLAPAAGCSSSCSSSNISSSSMHSGSA